MKTTLRIAFSLLFCAMVFFCFSSTAFAENIDSGTWGDLTWTLDENYVLSISGNGNMNDFEWDSSDAWAYHSENITSVIIENGVTSIGEFAFQNCTKMTSVIIPDTVSTIGAGSFCFCSSLADLIIPEGVQEIDDDAFFGCSSLTSVLIPASVTDLGGCVFANCTDLTSITVDPDNPSYCDIDGILYTKDLAVLWQHPAGRGDMYRIPDSVTRILYGTFYGCRKLTSITIPEKVNSIEISTFFGCSSLISITIPESVTSIGDYAFKGCSRLTSIAIPDSVTSIGDAAFNACSSLTRITIPESVTSIGRSAFYYCSNLTNITIPEIVTSIGEGTFSYCSNMTSITIPKGVTSIGDAAFYGCRNLADVYYAGTEAQWQEAISIGNYNDDLLKAKIHYNYVVPDLFLPNSLTTIQEEAFAGGAFHYVQLPEGAFSIGNRAFADCPNLQFIYIPESTTAIAKDAFENVSNLTIYGIDGSFAEFFASKHENCTFEAVS